MAPLGDDEMFELSAGNADALLSALVETDINVPLRKEGRTKRHRERYSVARLLSTLAHTELIKYPLTVKERDAPDFQLQMADVSVGVECVEAVTEEWAQIQAIRERDFPDAIVFIPKVKPTGKIYSNSERAAIARGERYGEPWYGKEAEQQ